MESRKFNQHKDDGIKIVKSNDIIAIDIAKDDYYAVVFVRTGDWVRLSKSFNELTSLLY